MSPEKMVMLIVYFSAAFKPPTIYNFLMGNVVSCWVNVGENSLKVYETVYELFRP